ncbi:MAG: ParB/RepB/Spo0J family partition protein, partial [Roseiflexaceae bacterium]|nr:ParB/RepB/Spo0J family partition protein [Roseiflexaceae bacterium]
MQLLYLDPQSLEADPEGVRESPGDIDGLAATIREQGLLQPLGVVPVGAGRYRVVYGNRRREAALKLGLEKVPCILLDENDPHTLLQQLTENLQRQDLNDLEKAKAFERLRELLKQQGQITGDGELDEGVGRAVGLGARTVRRYLGLLDLSEEIHDLLRTGELTVTQAQHLRRIPNQRTQLELARAAVDEGMSAAELSRLSSYFAANPSMTVDAALEALHQGVEVREQHAPVTAAGGGPLGKTSAGSLAVENDNDLWDDEDEVSEDNKGYLSTDDTTVENQPKNKARVFRIRSLDQMVDETDRIARAHVEGDLQKWVTSDDGAAFKLRLLYKQLNSVLRALKATASEQGWEIEE